jgi:fucokinase
LRWYYAISELAKLASLPAEQSARKSRHYAELAFHTLAGCIAAAKLEHATARKVDSWQRPEVSLELPVRIDLAGGWSDTPPFTLEKGGTVLNAAVALNAEFPLVVSVRRLAEPVVRLESADLAMSRVCTSMKQLSEYTDPRDPLAIHKAAFVLACVPDKCGLTLPGLCEKLGGGVCISSDVRLPKGTGLGVSSILAAGLVKGLYLAGANAGEEPSLTELFDAASLVEQMLTTGGGWQDQVGGLFPGLKLTTSAPGEYQRLSVAPITLSKKLAAQFDDRLLVLDTGQRRLAKNLLREIMGKWLAREPRTVSILHDIQRIARDMAEALAAGDFSAAGTLMWRHWELNKQLDEQTSNEFIDQLMISLRPYVEGAKLAGAGGGGFMMGIMKPGAREKIADMLATEYAGTNVKLYPAHVCWDI